MTDNIYATVRDRVLEALLDAVPDLPPETLARVEVTPTREAAHGDMATNAALIAAKPARQPPARIAAALAAALAAAPEIASAEPAGPGFVNLRLRPAALLAACRRSCGRRGVRRQHGRAGAPGERGVRVRQPDRADACRPLPRRRRGGRAGQPAGQGRLRRHQGVLRQRRRQPGGRPRLGGLLALPPGARHGADRGGVRRRRARAGCSTAATTWCRSGRRWRRSAATRWPGRG